MVKFDLPKPILEIAAKFNKAGYQLYLVGGAVRDLLMEKGVNDWDFTTDAKPEEILKLFPKGFYNNKFGTVGIPISKGVKESNESEESQVIEITTMRREGDYKDHRHPTEVGWTDKIEKDLKRRDFTINAVAMDAKTKIIDPFHGKEDLENKLIRSVGNPEDRFNEDALRLIRAIRFASQLGFAIEPKTLQAIKAKSNLIKTVANERVRDELFKLLVAPNGYQGLLLLRETGLLELILPEVEKCFGIVQEGPKHDRIYDIGDHSFRTMRETPSSDPIVKFASLLHDVGKAKTFKKELSGNVTFYNHDIVGANLSLNIAKRFNLSKQQTDKLFRLIRFHMFSTNENQTDSAIRRFIKNVGLKNVEDIMTLRIGDRLGGDTRKPVSWRMENFKERMAAVLQKPFSITDLKVNGGDVMKTLNIQPGPKVGQVLNKLFQEVAKDSSKNNRDTLLARIKELA